jgi:hypothetical protein
MGQVISFGLKEQLACQLSWNRICRAEILMARPFTTAITCIRPGQARPQLTAAIRGAFQVGS